MNQRLLALFAAGLLACSSGSDHGSDGGEDVAPHDAIGDAPAMDAAVMDAAVMDAPPNDAVEHDTATSDTAADQVSVDVPGDTSQRDVAPNDAPADAPRVCPVSCTNNDECAAACPTPGTGAYCCVVGHCVLSPTTCPAPPNDAGACTGTNQCDATHMCPTGRHCCAPLPGMEGCGFCSPGVCPG